MTPEEKKEKDAQDSRMIGIIAGVIVIILCVARLIAVYFFSVDVTGTSRRFGENSVIFYWVGLVAGLLLAGISFSGYKKNKKK